MPKMYCNLVKIGCMPYKLAFREGHKRLHVDIFPLLTFRTQVVKYSAFVVEIL